LLTQTYRTLNLRIQNLRFRSNLDERKWDLAMKDHRAIVDALQSRDGARLATILRAHLRLKGEAVLESLRLTHDARERRTGSR
jgi:DNA-binding GntR family transcriptional regulator